MDEFALIRQFFTGAQAPLSHVERFVGIGDDCAVIPSSQSDWVVCKDMLLEGRHFFSDVDPFLLGHKALAVNLSDLAAMAAKPVACLLGIALPHVDEPWLSRFSEGFNRLATRYDCALVGGDTTRSTEGIVVSVTALGTAAAPHVLRSEAKIGDDVWISGALGAPKVALDLLLKQQESELSASEAALLAATRSALEQPEPELNLALSIKPYIHAMIDISDGLLQDLSHILRASGVGAQIDYERIPIHPALQSLDATRIQQAILSGGDEYRLCFTAAPKYRSDIIQCAVNSRSEVQRIGRIIAGRELHLVDEKQQELRNLPQGFNHFA